MDAIETHHGTSLIKYFYVRAVEEAGGKIESMRRYIGIVVSQIPESLESSFLRIV